MNKFAIITKYMFIAVFVLSIVLYLGLHSFEVLGQDVNSVVVIDPNGVVNITMIVDLSEGLNKVALPVNPIPVTIIALSDGEELPIVYDEDEGCVYLYLAKPMKVVLSYIANVTVEGNVFTIDIRSQDLVEVRVSKDVILLSWPEENVVDVKYIDGVLTLTMRGPTTIRYTVRPATTITSIPQQTTTPPSTSIPTQVTTSPTTTPITTTPVQYPSPTSEQKTQTSSSPQREEGGAVVWLALALTLVIVGSVAYYLAISRKKSVGSPLTDVLGDVDIAIVKALEARGGSALQAELQNDVKVPRTTLWRHIKKLEKLGIVKIEKVGSQNRVTLVKKIKIT